MRGFIEEMAVTDLLGFMNSSRKNGVITLKNGNEQCKIILEHGNIIQAFRPDLEKELGNRLTRSGMISEDVVRQALELRKKSNPPAFLGASLLQTGRVNANAIRKVLAEIARDTVMHVVTWRAGEFKFDSAGVISLVDPIVANPDLVPRDMLNTQFLLMDAFNVVEDMAKKPSGSAEIAMPFGEETEDHFSARPSNMRTVVGQAPAQLLESTRGDQEDHFVHAAYAEEEIGPMRPPSLARRHETPAQVFPIAGEEEETTGEPTAIIMNPLAQGDAKEFAPPEPPFPFAPPHPEVKSETSITKRVHTGMEDQPRPVTGSDDRPNSGGKGPIELTLRVVNPYTQQSATAASSDFSQIFAHVIEEEDNHGGATLAGTKPPGLEGEEAANSLFNPFHTQTRAIPSGAQELKPAPQVRPRTSLPEFKARVSQAELPVRGKALLYSNSQTLLDELSNRCKRVGFAPFGSMDLTLLSRAIIEKGVVYPPPIVVAYIEGMDGRTMTEHGLSLLRDVSETNPLIPVVFLCDLNDVPSVHQLYRNGAWSLLPGPRSAISRGASRNSIVQDTAAAVEQVIADIYDRFLRVDEEIRRKLPGATQVRDYMKMQEPLLDRTSSIFQGNISLQLLRMVSDNLERGVLYVAREDHLSAIGAFGDTRQGFPISNLVKKLTLPYGPETALRKKLESKRMNIVRGKETSCVDGLYNIIGKPEVDKTVIIPVFGLDRLISLVVADNGVKDTFPLDLEFLEVFSGHVGLWLENNLLRQKIAMLERGKNGASHDGE
ncbi:MAG: hypothetical protein GMKNLPBB_02079 [Myxococcota bacterium]|nr:hypothetical protein [Myxococcota bacterium]